jgi:hypothetical protein
VFVETFLRLAFEASKLRRRLRCGLSQRNRWRCPGNPETRTPLPLLKHTTKMSGWKHETLEGRRGCFSTVRRPLAVTACDLHEEHRQRGNWSRSQMAAATSLVQRGPATSSLALVAETLLKDLVALSYPPWRVLGKNLLFLAAPRPISSHAEFSCSGATPSNHDARSQEPALRQGPTGRPIVKHLRRRSPLTRDATPRLKAAESGRKGLLEGRLKWLGSDAVIDGWSALRSFLRCEGPLNDSISDRCCRLDFSGQDDRYVSVAELCRNSFLAVS